MSGAREFCPQRLESAARADNFGMHCRGPPARADLAHADWFMLSADMTAPTLTAEPPSRVRWHIVALLMGLCFISHVNRTAMSVAGTDRIMDQYGVDPVAMGGVYTAFLLIYSLAMIPGGLFIDRFGARRALLLVGLGSAIFGALTGIAGWAVTTGAMLIPALLIVRGTMGLVSAPLHPAAARAIATWFPFAQRSWANGLVTAAAIAGVASCYPGFGFLVHYFDWPAAFLICAGLTTALTLAWARVAADDPARHPHVNAAERHWIQGDSGPDPASATPPGRPTAAVESWATLARNRNLLMLTFAYGAVGYFQYLFAYWMQYYLVKVLHVDATQSKVYASVLQVGLALGMPLGGWLSQRLTSALGVRAGRALVAGGGMTLSAALLGVGVLTHDPGWIVTWFALAHLAIGASEGPVWATAVDIGRRQGGTAAAICNTGGNVGGLLAPSLTPWISTHLGWPAGIALGGVICLLGALCWFWIDPLGRHKTSL